MDKGTSNIKINRKMPVRKGPMGSPMEGMGSFEKPKDFKRTVKKLIKYLSKYKIGIVVVIIFAIISTVFSIIGPKVLGNATTVIFEGLMNIIAQNR